MNKKLAWLFLLIFTANCSPIYLYGALPEQKESENNIKTLNQALTKALSANVLSRDTNGAIKKLLERNNFKESFAKESDLINADHADLLRRYDAHKKAKKTMIFDDFILYQDMSAFLQNSDLIASYYHKLSKDSRLLYDTVTKSNITIIGFYRSIDNVEEYREFAKKYIPGAKEYEDLRVPFVMEITKLKNELFDHGLKHDEETLAKITGGKKFCQKINNGSDNIAAYLNSGMNIDRECIYHAAGLRVIRNIKNAVLVTAYDQAGKNPAMINILVNTQKHRADFESLGGDEYIYYVGLHRYKVLYTDRTVNAFNEFSINAYPFLKTTLKRAETSPQFIIHK